MTDVAVVLSGCGFLDGAEIHESVMTLLALDSHELSYQCFAPDKPQQDVVNHYTKTPADEQRNVLTEAARIARGAIHPLSELDPAQFRAIVFPGGYGAAKNLCDFAVNGTGMQLDPEVERVARAFAEAGKPAGYICIAPAMIPRIYPAGVRCTIGTDTETAAALQAMGAEHQNCPVDDIVADERYKVVSTPAYMLARRISEAGAGIEKLVRQIRDWL
ncbi:isoprenoid biosynthesis glyoxalase ElbB [Hahella sp. SMD15-11]|uniref:Glyoxalase n=1 Tax=Thermohahella caldifontis TaxID=3142973 RepID=A0AB39UXC5_9GAMM